MKNNNDLIQYLLKNQPISRADIDRAKRQFCKLSGIKNPPTNSELLRELNKIKPINSKIISLKQSLRKRAIRTLSGIAPIAVLTKPWECPGNCAYCPKEKDVPTSYLSNEPAVMRAIRCKFDPYGQTHYRLQALANNGHPTDKLELIVMGGTWSYLPEKYQYWYILECFRAASDFPRNKKSNRNLSQNSKLNKLKITLTKIQKKNETAKARIIGLTLETRPDYINEPELIRMRELGCTRIEIGVQHIDDRILKLNRRGHDVSTTIKATELMRSFGFKITYHFMLNLPGSSIAKDFAMMKTAFSDPKFQPDQIKLYPTVVAKGSTLYKWWRNGKWKSYTTKQLINLLIKIKSITPPWVRIIRVIRDIPEESIQAGNKTTNLRQNIQREMTKQNISCACIRCREAGHASEEQKTITKNQNSKLIKREYLVNGGRELFISFESPNKKTLFAFCRIFLPHQNKNSTLLPSYPSTCLIRELHTYGQLTSIREKSTSTQHQGLGKKLVAEAEKIVKQHNHSILAIISGIGVRSYYRHLGYRLQNTYMTKSL